MRSYLIDEIAPGDMQRVESRLNELDLRSIDHLYHFLLPSKLLSDVQREHTDTCGPFYMAVESGRDWLKLELLVRARRSLHCGCIARATPEQELHMVSWLENLLRELDIRV